MLTTILLSAFLGLAQSPIVPVVEEGVKGYVPSAEVVAAKEQFRDNKFGVFIHWGVYSMLAQGEWVMHQQNVPYEEYSKYPGGFYPSRFNAAQWVRQIKASGAKYITITSRHHDGFSMFATKASPYNVVDDTPFGRDPLKELADACHAEGKGRLCPLPGFHVRANYGAAH